MTPEEISDLRIALDGYVEPTCWEEESRTSDIATIAVAGARDLLVELDARDAQIAALEARRDELIALTVRLTNEVPFSGEVKGWTAQRAAMIAEVGTLRARAAELEAAVQRLTVGASADDVQIAERDRAIEALTERVAELMPARETSASIAEWPNAKLQASEAELGDARIAIEQLETQVADRNARILHLEGLINTPHTDDFMQALRIEAAHQIERWGIEHDAGKRPEDWLALLVFLLGKATGSHYSGDIDKLKHHIITASAACLNWFRALTGDSNAMRPGVADRGPL